MGIPSRQLIPLLAILGTAIVLSGCSLRKRLHPAAPQASQVQYLVHEGSASQLRLGDRYFVVNSLAQIYGIKADDPILQAMVTTRIDQFGGSCDSHLPGDCTYRSQTQTASVPAMTAARGALMSRVCEKLNSNDGFVASAVTGLGDGKYTATSAPDQAGIRDAFEAFYPGRNPTAEVLRELANITHAAREHDGSPLDQWRFLLLTLCLAPDWQIP